MRQALVVYCQGIMTAPEVPPQPTEPPLAHIPYATTNPSSNDGGNLRVLSILHYVAAGFLALFGCMPIMHVIIGFVMLTGNFSSLVPMPPGQANPPAVAMPPAWFGYFFIFGGFFAIVMMWACAVLLFLSGRYLAQRRRHTFVMVVAAISCIFFPFGTALGVFTLVVINKDSVRAAFLSNH